MIWAAQRDGSGGGSATPAQKAVEEINAFGGEAVANYDNVATPEGGENIIRTAVDTFGKVDIPDQQCRYFKRQELC
ncbi:MAG: hypothetical protein R2874_01500 [Desulfobacterales bacterium]